MVFHRERGPCPALEAGDDITSCGLVVNPDKYANIRARLQGTTQERSDGAKLSTGTGRGCDALVEGEVPDLGFQENLRREGRKAQEDGRAMAVLKAWGVLQ